MDTMSNEDQIAAIGRIAIDLAEAKKQRALLVNALESISTELSELANSLRGDAPEAWKRSADLLNYLIAKKDLGYIKDLVLERMDLAVKLAELEKQARDVGIA